MHKRSRTIQEKIDECLDDKIQNLHPIFRKELNQLLNANLDIAAAVTKSKNYITKKYNFKALGKHNIQYWLQRGWSEIESSYKSSLYPKTNSGFSPFSKEFWIANGYSEEESEFKRNSQRPIRKEYWIVKGYSEEESIKLAIEQKNNNNKVGANANANRSKESRKSTSNRCKEFWILKEYSESDAMNEISKLQTTFSLDICIEKYGEAEGRLRWQRRQEKWAKNYTKTNFSKISQELFKSIQEVYNGDVYFATNDRIEMQDYQNKEYILKLNKSFCRPDFVCLKNKKIIEFDGDYWHSANVANPAREAERDNRIIEMGYEIFHVKESEYKHNKQLVIDKCKNFLTQ